MGKRYLVSEETLITTTKTPFTRYQIRMARHDIKLNSSTTIMALTLTIVWQKLTTSIDLEKSGESKYDR